jgi:protocatechuate 3,4-dioxygenase beta subunit
MLVRGAVADTAGRPVAGALVYAYHTSAKGWYSDRAPHFTNDDGKGGDSRHARLFGYVRTDAQGRFVLRTIRPGGYPRSELPEHVHWHASLDGKPIGSGELCFADDPRLTPEMRQTPEEGMTIAKPERENETLLFRTTFVVAPPAPAPAPAKK